MLILLVVDKVSPEERAGVEQLVQLPGNFIKCSDKLCFEKLILLPGNFIKCGEKLCVEKLIQLPEF